MHFRVYPLLNRGRPRLLEPPIGVMDLPAMIVFDDVILGRGRWGYLSATSKASIGERLNMASAIDRIATFKI